MTVDQARKMFDYAEEQLKQGTPTPGTSEGDLRRALTEWMSTADYLIQAHKAIIADLNNRTREEADHFSEMMDKG